MAEKQISSLQSENEVLTKQLQELQQEVEDSKEAATAYKS